jgi:uncharacterized LabA/DUF88 family protein
MRPKKNTVYAFIDSQNLNVGVQKFGWKMDWAKFRKHLEDKYNVSKAFMFIGYVPEFEAMYQQLHEAGYMIVLKPTYDMTRPRPEDKPEKTSAPGDKKQEEEKKPVKGNVDADLVLWTLKEMKHYDKAVVVSGDGDFYSLIEYLDEQRKLLKLLAPNAHYSGLFNKYEKYVERLDKSRAELAYHDHRRPRKPLKK